MIRKGSFITLSLAAIGLLGSIASIVALDNLPRLLIGVPAFSLLVGLAISFVKSAVTPSITAIPKRPSETLDEELGSAQEVWYSWHAGTVKAAEGDLFKRPRRTRMILTNPESSALQEMSKIYNLSVAEMQPGINALTKSVKAAGGTVAWFDGPIGNSMIIADPNVESGWARVEVLIPFGDPASRPSIRVEKKREPELFERMKESYERLFSSSHVK